jgi:hypothetical protein
MNTQLEMRDMKKRRFNDKPEAMLIAAMVITRFSWVVGGIVILCIFTLGTPEFIDLILEITGRNL